MKKIAAVTPRWLEEKLWLYGYSLDVGGQADRHFVFAINPQTLQTDTYELPERTQGGDTKFLIPPSYLLASLRGSFVVYDRAQKQWHSTGSRRETLCGNHSTTDTASASMSGTPPSFISAC